MATPPKARAIELDDALPVEEQLAQLKKQLDAFMSDVGNALDQGIDASNIRRQVKKLDITTNASGQPTPAVRFNVTLPTRPTSPYIAQLRTISGTAPSSALGVEQWTLVGGNVLEITTFTGLAANSRYAVTLFVE